MTICYAWPWSLLSLWSSWFIISVSWNYNLKIITDRFIQNLRSKCQHFFKSSLYHSITPTIFHQVCWELDFVKKRYLMKKYCQLSSSLHWANHLSSFFTDFSRTRQVDKLTSLGLFRRTTKRKNSCRCNLCRRPAFNLVGIRGCSIRSLT